eukprot:SAG11_NODE_1787_length_4257_cov_2.349928_4_plen_103_part_00
MRLKELNDIFCAAAFFGRLRTQVETAAEHWGTRHLCRQALPRPEYRYAVKAHVTGEEGEEKIIEVEPSACWRLLRSCSSLLLLVASTIALLAGFAGARAGII